jgi:hypothetical protein
MNRGQYWMGLGLIIALAVGCGTASSPSKPGGQSASETPVSAPSTTEPEKRPTSAPAEVTSLPYKSDTVGALQVTGDTRDWYNVMQDGKSALPGAPPLLNTTVELPPGNYEVSVNRTTRLAKIDLGKKTVLVTGTLVVEGTAADWYTPYQGKDRKVVSAPPRLNHPIALFPGTYTVFVHVNLKEEKLTDNALVVEGKKTVLKK